nr:MAG TPA: hypothetical protein [Caudoviricetes sp.]
MRLFDPIRAALGNSDGRLSDKVLDQACTKPTPEEQSRKVWCLDITIPGGPDDGTSLFYQTKYRADEALAKLDVPQDKQDDPVTIKDGYDRESILVKPRNVLCARVILVDIRAEDKEKLEESE